MDLWIINRNAHFFYCSIISNSLSPARSETRLLDIEAACTIISGVCAPGRRCRALQSYNSNAYPYGSG